MLTLNPYNLGMPHSKADVLVNPDEELEIEGVKVKFHHFPGHTPGCSMIEIKNFFRFTRRARRSYRLPCDPRETLKKTSK